MVGEIVTVVVSVVIGLLTGWFFEHRATKAAERQNVQLRRDIIALKTDVRSLGGDPDARRDPQPDSGLLEAVHARARATQDASGKVLRQELVAHFVQRGRAPDDVEDAVAELCSSGAAKMEGRWLQIL